MPKKATANKTKPKKSTAKKTSPVTSAAKDVAAKAEPTQKNLDIYGAKPLLWSRAVKQLDAGPPGGTFWLATTKPDGRPHVAGVGALWVDGKVYFVSGARTRKSRNLTANPNCVFSVSLTGIDLVIEKDGQLTLTWSSFTCPLEHFEDDTFRITAGYFDDQLVEFAGESGSVTALRFTGALFKRK